MQISKKIKIIFIVLQLLFVFSSIVINKPSIFPENKYIWPIGVPMKLSGTLGERRGYYFHHGIDIKTFGYNGHPVYALADGRLYRLSSKTRGYGNALFIEHSGGISSGYAHLDRFNDNKYSLNSFAELLKIFYNTRNVDFNFFDNSKFFKQGDTIAFSGESGSGFPHLHFEIRDKGGTPNPLKFVPLKDKIFPVIKDVFICIEKDNTTIYEKRVRVDSDSTGSEASEANIQIPASDRVFIKAACFDHIGAKNKLAVYKIQLFDNADKIFEIVFDRISWDESYYGRFVYDISKSMIDGKFTYTYNLCRKKGNDFSGIFSKNDGYLNIDRKKKLKIIVEDFAGHKAVSEFEVSAGNPPDFHPERFQNIRKAGYSITTAKKDILLKISPYNLSRSGSFFIEDNIKTDDYKFLEEEFFLRLKDIIKICRVYPSDILYRRPVSIIFKRPENISPGDIKKIYIYNFFQGGYPGVLYTVYNKRSDTFSARASTNGYFALIIDRDAPQITVSPTHDFYNDSGIYRRVRFNLNDNLSGVEFKYTRCYIDGSLYPFRYDRDRRWIELDFPLSTILKEPHHVLIYCRDNADNYREFRGIMGF